MSKIQSDGSTASYYELQEGATELQELISAKNMNAQIGEIFRACYRYGEVARVGKNHGSLAHYDSQIVMGTNNY